MSEVMMGVLQRQVESLTRQVEQLGPENERVRKLLTEFAQRHDGDQVEIERLRDALKEVHRDCVERAKMSKDGRTVPLGASCWMQVCEALEKSE